MPALNFQLDQNWFNPPHNSAQKSAKTIYRTNSAQARLTAQFRTSFSTQYFPLMRN
jgi:hypothetical protein